MTWYLARTLFNPFSYSFVFVSTTNTIRLRTDASGSGGDVRPTNRFYWAIHQYIYSDKKTKRKRTKQNERKIQRYKERKKGRRKGYVLCELADSRYFLSLSRWGVYRAQEMNRVKTCNQLKAPFCLGSRFDHHRGNDGRHNGTHGLMLFDREPHGRSIEIPSFCTSFVRNRLFFFLHAFYLLQISVRGAQEGDCVLFRTGNGH